MKVRYFRTIKLEKVDEIEVTKIMGIDENDEEEKEDVKNGAEPLLNCCTTDGSFVSIPIELLIEIRGD